VELLLVGKLFIADPALANHQGHHFSVTSSFSKFAEDLGYDVIWLVNRGFSFEAEDRSRGYRVHRTFSDGTYDVYKKKVPTSFFVRIKSHLKYKIRKLPEPAKAKIRCLFEYLSVTLLKIKLVTRSPHKIISDLGAGANNTVKKCTASQELLEAISKFKTTPNDIILFHTCDAHTYSDIVQLFIETIEISKWNSLPILHLSTPYDDLVMPHNKTNMACNHSVRYLDAMGLINSRIFLHAENELLAKYLQNQWSLDVGALYIPQQAISVKSEEDAKLNICYLGAARTEKGFPLVAKAVMEFLATNERTEISFTLQISSQIMGYTHDVERMVKKLKAVNDTRLHLIEAVQTPEQYEQVLAKTDALFLCYEKNRYAVRSSGIVIEALANAKNVIVTKGTFPEFIAAESGISVEGVDDVVNAIDTLANKRDYYHQLAKERSEVFQNEISSKGMTALLSKKGYNASFFNNELKQVVVDTSSSVEKLEYIQLI
jgi:hypothetical protein